jgi:hypothetical protein
MVGQPLPRSVYAALVRQDCLEVSPPGILICMKRKSESHDPEALIYQKIGVL